jgi:hypothetical protein
MTALQKIIISAYQNDRAAVTQGAVDIGCIKEQQSALAKESFTDFCILLMEPFRINKESIPDFALNSKGQYKWRDSKLLKRAGKFAAQSISVDGFSSPPKEFALIARKLSGVFSFVTSLGAELDSHSVIEKHINSSEPYRT